MPARGTYLCIMAVMVRSPSFLRSLPGRASVHAKEISFTFYDELVIMPYAGLENGGLAWCIFSFLGWTTGHVEQDSSNIRCILEHFAPGRPKPRPRGAINHVYINLGARQILPGKRSDRVQPGHNKCSRNANEQSEDGRRRSRLHFHFLKMGK